VSEKYGLSPQFELAVLRFAAVSPSFQRRVGYAVDAAFMDHPQADLILRACRAIEVESGRPPASTVIVVQRVRRWVAEGRVKMDAFAAVGQTFDEADDLPPISEEEVIAEFAPILRRRMQSDAVIKAHDEYGRRGDFRSVMEALERANKLGESELVRDVALSAQGLSIFDLAQADRLPTGIFELDNALDGGLQRGALGTVLAESGGGKSQFLISQAAESVRLGRSTLFVTLELPQSVQMARLAANITGVPTNAIMQSASARKQVEAALASGASTRGPCWIAEFDPHVTSVQEVTRWVGEKEQESGRPAEVLIVDYGDKLTDPRAKQDNEYLALRYVWEGMRRDIAVAKQMWVWTASQVSRRGDKDRKKHIDMHNTADSMHKVRVSDLVVSINPCGDEGQDDASQVELFVAKHRLGRSRFVVGPVFTDFACGRISLPTGI